MSEGTPTEQREVYGEALEGFDRSLASADEDAEGPAAVAEVIEKALTASSPDERYMVCRGARSLTVLEPLLPAALFDRVKRRVAA